MNNPQVNGDQNQSVNSVSNHNPNFNLCQNSSSNPQSLSDENLYQLCRTYGARALEWRRKFTGLLPEVFKRKLYEKKGFDSVFVFAKKLAGLSEEQVRLVLNLEKRFENVPALQTLLVNGEVSVNKLARVAAIANPENQEFLAEQVQILSKGAVETLVRDEKWARENCGGIVGGASADLFGNFGDLSGLRGKNSNGLLEPENGAKFVRAHKSAQSISAASSDEKNKVVWNGWMSQAVNLSPEVHKKLLELQQKGLDLNQILLEFLKKREEEIAQRKEKIAEKVLQKEEEKAQKKAQIEEEILKSSPKGELKGGVVVQPRPHIPVAVKKILHDEHGTKCSIKNCQKLAETIHHTQRFALSGSHDPHYLAPLCKEHHEIAHAVDVRCHEVKKRWVRA